MDDTTGTLEIPNGEFHDIEYGSSALFDGDDLPTTPTNQIRTERWDDVRLRLRGQTEEHIAKAYLEGLYKALLALSPNQGSLTPRSIVSENDFSNLFADFPGQFTESPCLVTSMSDFNKVLGVAYSFSSLRIQFGLGQKYHNRDLLGHGEPLIQFAGKPVQRLITAERYAIAFNLPQIITPVPGRLGDYSTTLQFKITHPDLVKIYDVPAK